MSDRKGETGHHWSVLEVKTKEKGEMSVVTSRGRPSRRTQSKTTKREDPDSETPTVHRVLPLIEGRQGHPPNSVNETRDQGRDQR